jgi:hypothetical protein
VIYRSLSRLALWASWYRVDWLAALIYRICCPYPIIPDHSARACIAAGLCGCDNKPPSKPRVRRSIPRNFKPPSLRSAGRTHQ